MYSIDNLIRNTTTNFY